MPAIQLKALLNGGFKITNNACSFLWGDRRPRC